MLRNKASVIGTSPVNQKYTTTLLALVKKYIPKRVQNEWLKTFPIESIQMQINYLKERAMAFEKRIQESSSPVIKLDKEIHLLQNALQVINNAKPVNFRTYQVVQDIAARYDLNLKNLIKENLLSILNTKLSEAQYHFNRLSSQLPFPVSALKKLDLFLEKVKQVENEYQNFFSLQDLQNDEQIQNKKEEIKPKDRGHSTQKIIQTMQASSQASLPLEMPVVSTSSSSESCSRSVSLESRSESAPESSHSVACANPVTLSHSVPSSKHKSKYPNCSDHKSGDEIFDFDLDEEFNFPDSVVKHEQDDSIVQSDLCDKKEEKTPIVFINPPEDKFYKWDEERKNRLKQLAALEDIRLHELRKSQQTNSHRGVIPTPGKRY